LIKFALLIYQSKPIRTRRKAEQISKLKTVQSSPTAQQQQQSNSKATAKQQQSNSKATAKQQYVSVSL
jgi:hypothetical protein